MVFADKNKFILFFLFGLLVSLDVYAKDSGVLKESYIYEDVYSVPAVLSKGIRPDVYREQYISNVLSFIRTSSPNKQYLNEKIIKAKEEEILRSKRQKQRASVMKYDENLDGQVTLDEIREGILKRNPNYNVSKYKKSFDREVQNISAIDRNSDGIIKIEEMTSLTKNEEKSLIEKQFQTHYAYMALDPNDDAILTSKELYSLAVNAFSVFDKNNDFVISKKEFALFRKSAPLVGTGWSVPPTDTPFPASSIPLHCHKKQSVNNNTRIISVGTKSGATMSTVTTSGQNVETQTVEVKIDKGAPKSYLILSSYNPIIWRITGNVGSIEGVTVTHVNHGAEINASGVTGISKDKVSYIDRMCLEPANLHGRAKKSMLDRTVKHLTGRYPDIHTQGERSTILYVTSEEVVFDLSNPKKAEVKPNLEGFHKALWGSLLKQYSGGIVDIDPKSVASARPAEKYEVFPNGFGIAKLAHDGFIEILDSKNFRIIKDIPRYPSGLVGVNYVRFFIAEGVNPPKGTAGQSCIIIEKTGKALSFSPLCRRFE